MSFQNQAPTPQQNVNVRGVPLTNDDINKITRVLYSEYSGKYNPTRTYDPKELLGITNTIINRAANHGKTIQDVISEPNQYKGYGGIQYNAAANPASLSPVTQSPFYDTLLQELCFWSFNGI
jgi:hypothetical protein